MALGLFLPLAAVDSVLWTFLYKYLFFFKYLFSVLFGSYLGAEFPGHMETLCWTFWHGQTGLGHLQTELTTSHAHPQCRRVMTSPYPCQHLLWDFWAPAILVGVKRYPTELLICTVRTSDAEHLFMMAVCRSLKKCLFRSIAHFFFFFKFVDLARMKILVPLLAILT